jgi:hypothetical protein
VAGQEVLHHQRAAAIDDMFEPDARELRQILHGKMAGAADRGRAVAHPARTLRLAMVDELLGDLAGKLGWTASTFATSPTMATGAKLFTLS